MYLLQNGDSESKLFASMCMWSFVASSEQCRQYGGLVHVSKHRFKQIIANTSGALEALALLLRTGSQDAKLNAAGQLGPLLLAEYCIEFE